MNAAMHDDISVPTQESHYDKKGIVLQPFLHQVSGRAAILSLDKTTVCKPLNYREHKFYKSLPPDIMEFTPRYKGIVNVNVEETADGSVALTAYPSKSLEDEASSTSSSSSQQDSCQVTTSSSTSSSSNTTTTTTTTTKTAKRRGSKHHMHHHHTSGGGGQQQEPTSFFPQLLQQVCTKSSSSSLCDVAIAVSSTKQSTATSGGGIARRDSTTTVNPWTFKVQREGLRRYLQSEQRTQKCILLENVASKFRKPCILDLKMGTRIHGDYDDRDKRLRHQMKSAATTTKKLGIRLCGMQVYDARTNSFHCRDKYFGRTLDRSALKSALCRFFHGSTTTTTSASGSDVSSAAGEMISTVIERLRVIRDSLNRLGSYRFYSSSLLIIYDGDVSSKTGGDDSGGGVAASSSQDQQRRHQSLPPPPPHRNKVDIRMVDFAKSTNRYLDGSVVHEGPDLGYIFGLTNLITLLGEIAVGKNSSSSSSSSSSEEEDEEEIC